MKTFALSLAFVMRFKATLKRPIEPRVPKHTHVHANVTVSAVLGCVHTCAFSKLSIFALPKTNHQELSVLLSLRQKRHVKNRPERNVCATGFLFTVHTRKKVSTLDRVRFGRHAFLTKLSSFSNVFAWTRGVFKGSRIDVDGTLISLIWKLFQYTNKSLNNI